MEPYDVMTVAMEPIRCAVYVTIRGVLPDWPARERGLKDHASTPATKMELIAGVRSKRVAGGAATKVTKVTKRDGAESR